MLPTIGSSTITRIQAERCLRSRDPASCRARRSGRTPTERSSRGRGRRPRRRWRGATACEQPNLPRSWHDDRHPHPPPPQSHDLRSRRVRPGDPAAPPRDDRLVRGEGAGADRRGGPKGRVVRRLHRVPRERARVRDPAHARARRRRRSGQALGHRPERRLQRDPGLLRTALLVRVAGHDPRAGADLADRTTTPPAGVPPSSSRKARSSRSASPSRTTAPTSTRPTWCSHPTATAASPPAAASTTSATETWPGWSRCSAGARTWRGRRGTCSSPRTARTPPTCCERTSSTARCT